MNNLEKAKEIVERGNKLSEIINNLRESEYFNFNVGNYTGGNIGINYGSGRGKVIQDDELEKDLQELRKKYLLKYKNELHKLNDEPLEESEEDQIKKGIDSGYYGQLEKDYDDLCKEVGEIKDYLKENVSENIYNECIDSDESPFGCLKVIKKLNENYEGLIRKLNNISESAMQINNEILK